MYSCGPLHMAEQRQADQLEPIYSSSVPIWDVFLKTCRKQWTIGRGDERGSGILVLKARHGDDDVDWKSCLLCLLFLLLFNLLYPCVFFLFLVIIIRSHCQHRSPWPSLATRLYRPSISGSPPGHIPYRHKATGHPTFARPCEEVHRSTSLMNSSLLLQQCPACLVHLIWIVFEMGFRCPYSYCFVGCCLQDLFNVARSILA